MRRKISFAIGITVVAVVAGALWLAPAGAAQSVTVVEHAFTDKVIDTGKPGDSSGDLLTFHNQIFDSTDTNKVGTDQGLCIREAPHKGTWECMWTTTLSDGQITVEGPFSDTTDTVVAITGGTGVYATAAGSMDLHCYPASDGSGRCQFTFNLVP
jgi:allene oxide cyclase